MAKNRCAQCCLDTDLDVCPECFTVLKGDNKGKDYYDLSEKDQKGLRIV